MNLEYVVARVIRHFMPEGLTRFLLLRSLIIRPGLETADPVAAARRYAEALADHERRLEGHRVLVFGYGGRFDIAIQLLQAGASQVVLYDRFAPPDARHNTALATKYPEFFRVERRQATPDPERILIPRLDSGTEVARFSFQPVDYVVSTSVYEHLADVTGTTRALAGLTVPDGLHIHFVDLRDHFFKYPFEMLRYSERTWRNWLDPTSHHNRFRVWEYRQAFEAFFRQVEIDFLERDQTGFALMQHHIRPEFKRDDSPENSVTLIRVVAEGPRLSA